MEKGQPVGILIGAQGGLVHETTDGEMRHQQTIELLPYQIRRLTAQDDMSAPQVSLEFIERRFDLPAFVIERRQFGGWRECVAQNRGSQPIQRLCPLDSFQAVFDDPYHDSVARATLVLL